MTDGIETGFSLQEKRAIYLKRLENACDNRTECRRTFEESKKQLAYAESDVKHYEELYDKTVKEIDKADEISQLCEVDLAGFVPNGPNICHPGRPYSKLIDVGGKWQHPQAREVYDGDTWVRYRCPLCAHQWCEELPQ